MKKGVIFDQDGILFDTERLYVQGWKYAGSTMNVDVPEVFFRAIAGSSGQRMLDIIHEHIPGVDPSEFRHLCMDWTHREQDRFLPEKPGLHEIITFFIENGCEIAVASSSQLVRIEKNLCTAGIRDSISHIVTGDDVEHGKPHPEIFLKAAQQLELEPEECYVFEDSFNGIRAGHASGCFTVMIPDLQEPTAEISQLYDACCKDFFEVIECIQRGAF